MKLAGYTARELRVQAREQESALTRLILLQRLANELAQQSKARVALTQALQLLIRHLSIDAGLVLQLSGGALTVTSAVGPVIPIGASTPSGGVLADVLRAPMQAVLRERLASRFHVGPHNAAFEWLVPIKLGGRALGVLALLSTSNTATPDVGDQDLVQACATLMAGTLTEGNTNRTKRPNSQSLAMINRLTARERQVLSQLPSGASNLVIASELGIAPGTVKIHVERILHKLGVADRTAAAIIAADCGMRP